MTITFHDKELVEAVKAIIVNNQYDIVRDVTHQGQPREMAIITTSKLTPPTEFYYCSIDIPSSNTSQEDGFDWIEYTVEIRVGDYAITQPGEDELYEQIHSDFRTVCNRIASYLTADRFITTSDGSIKFTIGSKPDIEKDSLTGLTPIDGAMHLMLASMIRITVTERCL